MNRSFKLHDESALCQYCYTRDFGDCCQIGANLFCYKNDFKSFNIHKQIQPYASDLLRIQQPPGNTGHSSVAVKSNESKYNTSHTERRYRTDSVTRNDINRYTGSCIKPSTVIKMAAVMENVFLHVHAYQRL